jgi:syntaxin 7
LQDGRELASLAQPPALDKANQELKGIQFRAVTAFNRLREDVARLGTSADTPELRRRLAATTQRFGELAGQFREHAGKHPAKDSTAAQKIMRDFQGLLKASEKLMATARGKEAASLPRAPPAAGAAAAAAAALQDEQSAAARAGVERQALLEQQRKQELLRIEGDLQFNEALIEERDQAIGEISGQIGEVHQIFQDLAVLVHDQGDMLGDIEANLTRAADSAADARVQIVRAERSQRRANKTWCFLMMLAAGVLAILLLIILS